MSENRSIREFRKNIEDNNQKELIRLRNTEIMNSMGSFAYGKMSRKHVKIVNENGFPAFASHAKRRTVP